MKKQNAELQAIANTIDLYVQGVRNGDVEKLRKAFHPKAMMYTMTADGPAVIEIEGLYGFVGSNDAPAKTGEPHQCFITSIHHSGSAASVEMIEEAAFGNDYMNYFQLLQIDGNWTIVSKTYNVTTPKS